MDRKSGTGKGWKWLLVLGVLVVAGLTLGGCNSAMLSYQGAILAPSSLIPLEDGAKRGDHFETRDIILDYEYVRNGDGLRLSGVVQYAPSIQHNFAMVPDFYLRLYLAGAQGNVLSYHQVPVSGYGYSSDVMRFTYQFALPPGTAFMAFGYSGYARDTGGHGDDAGGSTQTQFFYDPAAR